MTEAIKAATSEPTVTLGAGLDLLGSGPISNIPYVSEEFYERELAIWRDSWLLVGRTSDLEEIGDHITFDLDCIQAAIFVIRSSDGKLRAFHNVCSHRAGRLIIDKAAKGKSRNLTCPFHAWVFSLDGKLLNIPRKELFPYIESLSGLSLKEIALDCWGGFVFINLQTSPSVSLSDYLAGPPDTLSRYLDDRPWTWYTGYRQTYKANWKDLMNIQHEGYHATFLHRKTLGVNFAPENCANTVFTDSPGMCSLLTVSRPESTGDSTSNMSVVRRMAMQFGRTSNWVRSAEDESPEARQFAGAVNHADAPLWVFDCYTLFPNTLLFVGGSVLVVMRVWPLSVHESIWEWDWYFDHKPGNFGELFNIEHGRIATRNAVAEDWGLIEEVHKNMRAGVFESTHIGRDMEATVRAHYDALLRRVPLRANGGET